FKPWMSTKRYGVRRLSPSPVARYEKASEFTIAAHFDPIGAGAGHCWVSPIGGTLARCDDPFGFHQHHIPRVPAIILSMIANEDLLRHAVENLTRRQRGRER
ncbi:MAG TPA: hypothetical protein VF219_21220, partial [Vicinamibacterales bacterium]